MRVSLKILLLFTCLTSALAQDDGGRSFGTKFNAGFDHRAHAVPGGPYSVLDVYDAGSAIVKLIGSNSHTHFFNPANGEVGKITRYRWQAYGKTLCTTVNCNARFRRGSHRATLTVWDSTGDVAYASTAIYVLAPNRPGVTFLFYPRRLLFPDGPLSGGKATFSTVEKGIAYFTKTDFPTWIREIPFSIKVYASLHFPVSGVYQLKLECGGADCNMFIEGKQVGSTRHRTGNTKSSSIPMFVRKGKKSVHVVFVRRSSTWPSPYLTLFRKSPTNSKWHIVPPTSFTRNPAAYPPTIHSITPATGPVGSVITLAGSSFVEVSRVSIGGNACVGVDVKSENKLTCVLPGGSGSKKVIIHTSTKKESNGVIFRYTKPRAVKVDPRKRRLPPPLTGKVGYYQEIGFRKSELKWTNGKLFKGKQLTTITIGPDLKYYIGSLNGFVHVLTIGPGHMVQDSCRSANIGFTRSILGLAFNPADFPKIKLYASTNVLDWGVKKLMTPFHGWRNGEVILFEPRNNPAACMVKTKTVISGLPVSNHDHGVNSLAFNSFGSLLVSVGGSTNAGISTPNDFMGGVPDSPLSGAILVARPDSWGFNGKVNYDKPWNPLTTKKIAGTIEIFATGLRNSMGLVLHSSGKIYATDNGANPGYGMKSTNCWGGKIASVLEPDSFKMIIKGSYQGYANLNRGRAGDLRQCVHHSPWSKGKAWTKPLTTLEPSTNGIIEYTANTFGAQMRGDVLASKFSIQTSGKTYRIQIGPQGGVKSLSTLADFSGLSPVMTPRGAIIMPRVYQGTVAVLEPVEKNPGLTVVTSVTPIRGSRKGGIKVTITGWNLFPPLQAYFGGKVCKGQSDFKKDGRSFSCQLPAGFGKVPVIVQRGNGAQSSSYGWEFWYMEV